VHSSLLYVWEAEIFTWQSRWRCWWWWRWLIDNDNLLGLNLGFRKLLFSRLSRAQRFFGFHRRLLRHLRPLNSQRLAFSTSNLLVSLHYGHLYQYSGFRQRRRGLTKLRGQEVEIFRQTAANFRQRRLSVLKILILPLNSPTLEDFQPQILYFWKKMFPEEENFLKG